MLGAMREKPTTQGPKERRGVAGIIFNGDQILLVKRKYGSKKGFWCIPCGHVEQGEDPRDAVVREIIEETHLHCKVMSCVSEQSTIRENGSVYIGSWYMLNVEGGELMADDDAEEAYFFSLNSLPENMAFKSDINIIKRLRENKLYSLFSTCAL